MYKQVIPCYSVFVGHGYVQHDGPGWSELHKLQCHACIVLGARHLKYALTVSNAPSVDQMAGFLVLEGSESGDKEKRGEEGVRSQRGEKPAQKMAR